MAVYKRTYKPYAGSLTASWSRFLVIARYALETLYQSRLLVAFTVICYVFPIICGVLIYLHHNLSALTVLNLDPEKLMPINAEFFAIFLSVQGALAFLLTMYAGPGLVSPDLTNNALPLYLCRPISRWEYVIGKMAVLYIPLSAITWVPGLILFSMQSGLASNGWAWNNGRLAVAVFLGSIVWISVLSLMALALSAWVRWKLAASALLFGIFFVSSGFGEMVNEVLETNKGHLFNIGHIIGTVWANMLQISARKSILGEMFDIRRGEEYPIWAAWLMLGLICAACVMLLNRRLRAREVVR